MEDTPKSHMLTRAMKKNFGQNLYTKMKDFFQDKKRSKEMYRMYKDIPYKFFPPHVV